MEKGIEELVPPHNLDAEMSVLGAVLLDSEIVPELGTILKPEDFYRRPHQLLFRTILQLANEEDKVDAVTLHARLVRESIVDEVGGKAYLASLLQTLPSTAHVLAHAKLVKECAIRRRLMRTCDEIRAESMTGRLDCENLVDLAEQRIFEISNEDGKNETVEVGDILAETVEKIGAMQGARGGITGIDTGYYRLNDRTGGFQRGDLVIIAARPSMGKTTFAINCALNACLGDGSTVLFFSLEMGAEQILTNMLCATASVDASRLRRGQLSKPDWDKLHDAATRLHGAPFLIDTSSGVTPMSIRTKARRVKARRGKLDLIIVDYLQMMGTPSAESRQQEIAMISRALKGLARELECPVLALSQLNRALESRKDHRPQLSDLRESGAIEQDADLIVFLHREDYYSGEAQAPDQGRKTEVIIGKQRNGPTGKVELLFFPNRLRFENYAEGIE